jgi:hypothetical protein
MPQIVSAVVTDRWREKLARIYASNSGLGAFSAPSYFKIAEGGWVDPGSGKEPVTPSPTLTDVTAGTGIYTSPSDFIFQKSLTGSDLIFTSPNRLEIRCIVATGEANDDGHGNPPEFFELGVFDASNNMLVYSTFPVEIKTNSKTLQHVIYVDF